MCFNLLLQFMTNFYLKTSPSAVLSITIMLFGSLTPVSVTGKVSLLGGVVSSGTAELSVITIHGGSPSPVYLSTAALLTYVYIIHYNCRTDRMSKGRVNCGCHCTSCGSECTCIFQSFVSQEMERSIVLAS